MNEFVTEEQVKGLFSQINCLENDNCIFVSYKDSSYGGLAGGLSVVGGIVGAAAAYAIGNSKNNLFDIPYNGLLINRLKDRFAFIPITNVKKSLSLNPIKMVANPDYSFVVKNEDIKSVKIFKYNHVNIRMKSLIIKLKSGDSIALIVNNKEKNIPYHDANFIRFQNMYKD